MGPDLAAFLNRHSSGAEEFTAWDGGRLRFRVTSYLSREQPPLDFITSVRAVVTQGAAVLVVRDPDTVHILPGGRCEAGETPLQTLCREVLEETGWTLGSTELLGFLHFHHLGPMPPGYSYAYPDLLQGVYWAQAATYRADARQVGGYELDSSFRPFAGVQALKLTAGERLYLKRVLELLRECE
jgi:8-oxo-dGTP pyrophosphatase MutT (NUDIX family)